MRNKPKSVRTAVVWSSVEAVIKQLFQFGITVVLARLISPHDFGVMAIVGLVIVVGTVISDSGLGSAIVQKQNITQRETSSVFVCNLCLGVICGGMVAAVSPYLAIFYNEPKINEVKWWIALTLVISSLGTVHSNLLQRDLDFKTQTKITTITAIASGAIAIYVGYAGYGIWALVAQVLSATIINVLLLWILRDWRPIGGVSIQEIKSLYKFGGFLFAVALVDNIYNRLQYLAVGRIYSTVDLGMYARADATRQLPVSALTSIFDRILYPTLSRAQGDPLLMVQMAQKSVRALMFLTVPICFGLAAVSESFVRVVYGPMWLQCVPYIQILAISSVFWPLHVVNLTILKSLGRSDLVLRAEIAKKTLGLLTIMGFAFVSIAALAWSVLMLNLLSFYINAYYVDKILGWSARQQLSIARTFTIRALLASLAAFVIHTYLSKYSPLISFIVEITTLTLVYIAANVMMREPLIDEIVKMLCRYKDKTGRVK